MPEIKGGCLCGSVRWETQAEPAMIAVCHCVACQKYTGSAYSYNVAFPADTVTISGESLATYEDKSGASGNILYRNFCSLCGSPISGQGDAYPGLIFMKAETLDDPSWAKPGAHIWCAEKLPWVEIDEGVKQFAGNPE